MKLNKIEKAIEAIEKILDKGDADADQAATWYAYGFTTKQVQQYMDLRILDADTARALELLGCRVGLIERRRAQLRRQEAAEA